MRTHGRMRIRRSPRFLLAALVLVPVLCAAPSALAASALDQYTEGLPSAKGQAPTGGGTNGGRPVGGGAQSGEGAALSHSTRSQLGKTRNGSAAAKAADLTASGRSAVSGNVTSDTSDTGDGMGLLLPLILVAALVLAIAIVVGRRRLGPSAG